MSLMLMRFNRYSAVLVAILGSKMSQGGSCPSN